METGRHRPVSADSGVASLVIRGGRRPRRNEHMAAATRRTDPILPGGIRIFGALHLEDEGCRLVMSQARRYE